MSLMNNVSGYLKAERLELFIPVIIGIGILIGVNYPNWNLLYLYLALAIFKMGWLRNIILLLTIGFYVAQTGGIFNTTLLTNKRYLATEQTLPFQAIVKHIDETHPVMKNMRRIIFKDIKFKQNNLNYIKTAKMTCSIKATNGIQPGDKVSVFGRIVPFKSAVIPCSFDQKQYFTLQGIDTTGIVFKIKKIGQTKYRDIFSTWRYNLTKNIISKLGAVTGGIASALITGDKSSIPFNVREIFIKSGTAHILAISGLHMSLIATIIYFCLFRILLYVSHCFFKLNPHKTATILTIVLTTGYLMLSGNTPSATRAYIMTSIGLIGLMLGRSVISMRNVSFVATLLLLINSGALFSVGFQLSFSAVVALIAFYERFASLFNRIHSKNLLMKFSIYVLFSLITTIVATIATTPISIAIFNRLSLGGIVGNIVAIPIVSFLIMPALLLYLITFGKFTYLLSLLINKLVSILTICSNFPYTDITVKSPHMSTLYIIIAGGIILCLCLTKLRCIGSILILAGFLLWIFEKNPICVILPNTNTICFVKNNEFYTTNKKKGRVAVTAIQRNLGYSRTTLQSGIKLCVDLRKYERGCFIWADGTIKTLSTSSHPYASVRYIRVHDSISITTE